MAGKASALFVACVALLALSPAHAARDIVNLEEYGLGRVDMGALRKLTQFGLGSGGISFPGSNDSPGSTDSPPPVDSSPSSTPSPSPSPSPSSASAPTGVSATDNGDGTVSVSFSSSGSSFVAEAVPAGGSQGSGSNPSSQGSSSPITLSTSDGLESGTTYTFYVTLTSDGQSLVSSPSRPVAFSTGSTSPLDASPDASPDSSPDSSPTTSRFVAGPTSENTSPATSQSGGSAPATEGDVSAIAGSEANLNFTSNLGGDDSEGEVDSKLVGMVGDASSPSELASILSGKAASIKSCGVAFAAGIKSGKDLTTFCHGWGMAVVEAVQAGKTQDALNFCSSSVVGIVLVSINVSVTVATQACSELVIFIINSGSCTIIVKQFILNLFSIIISISTKSTAFVIA